MHIVLFYKDGENVAFFFKEIVQFEGGRLKEWDSVNNEINGLQMKMRSLSNQRLCKIKHSYGIYFSS